MMHFLTYVSAAFAYGAPTPNFLPSDGGTASTALHSPDREDGGGIRRLLSNGQRSEASSMSIPPSAFAALLFSGFRQKDNVSAAIEAGQQLVEERFVPQVEMLNGSSNVVVFGVNEHFAPEVLRGLKCIFQKTLTADRSKHTFERWKCPIGGAMSLTYVLVTCTSKGVVNEEVGCKFDRAMEYVMIVERDQFAHVKWFGLGDDDVFFEPELLNDFLGHYNDQERIALNMAADTYADQRSAKGRVNVKWNIVARKCNAVLPERLLGAVFTRPLAEVAIHDFENEAMEKLCNSFDHQAPDTVQALLFWMYDAKWVPVGMLSHDNEGFDETRLPKVPHLMISHKLRSKDAFTKYVTIRERNFPKPEALVGRQYRDSKHSKMKGSAWTLTPENCLPERLAENVPERHVGFVSNQDIRPSGDETLNLAFTSSDELFNFAKFRNVAPPKGVNYSPSPFEKQWILHRNDPSWLDDPCPKLNSFQVEVATWLQTAQDPCDPAVFSQISLPKSARDGAIISEYIEPLSFVLRNPKATCGGDLMDKSWLVLATKDMPRTTTGKRKLFDAGGENYGSSTGWLVDEYQKRGVVIDEVFVWEAKKQPDYFSHVPDEMKKKIHYFDGVPVVHDENSPNNPVTRLATECSEEDFCVLKLDIDVPKLETTLVQQLFDGAAKGKVDEFFFEHHVNGRMAKYAWGGGVMGKVSDSYEALVRLREIGIRAHSWV